MVSLLHCLCVALSFAGQGTVQDSTASIYGRILDRKREPVPNAQVIVVGGSIGVLTDGRGNYDFRRLPPGRLTLRVRAIGYESVTRTLTLRRAQRLEWNVALAVPAWLARAAQQESTLAAAGAVDSVAMGLLSADTAAAFTYERFGIRFLHAALRHSSPDTSRVVSPFSAGQALAMALGAARDSTALAIERGLEIGALGSEGLATRSLRFNRAARVRRDVTLKVADALWVDTSETLQPSFARWAYDRFGATVRTQPLLSPQFVADLNRWAERETDGAIRKLRDEPFDSSVKVVLTNAVYFKGRWLEPFDSSLTEDRPFTTARGERIMTPTMERTAGFGYHQGPGYRALRIPYAAGLTAMYVVLPDSGVRAQDLLDSLERNAWPMPNPRTETKTVRVQFPRLHLEQGTDLQPALTDLDMGILFDSTRADFNGLVVPRPDRPPPCPPLSSGLHVDACTRFYVSEAAQRVYLDVDEKGTVAAAVTSLAIGVFVTAAPMPIDFYVDRPFLFALRDERTGTLLFVGYIASPRQ